MSDYRQAQEQQEHQEWLEALDKALQSDDEKVMREMSAKLQEYMDGRVQSYQ